MPPSHPPFPIWRLRIVSLVLLVVLSAGYGWLLIARAERMSAAGPAAVESVVHAAVLGSLVRVAIGALLIFVLTHAIHVRDRRLADYAARLEKILDTRTREAQQRGRGIRLLLDHVGQGLVTIDVQGVMDRDRSAVLERWFGAVPDGGTFVDLLGRHAPEFAVWFELALDGVREGTLPLEVVIDQFPRRFTRGEQHFEVTYSPILDGARLDRILLVVSDVTARVEADGAERAEHELMTVFRRISHDRTGFEEFIDETSDLVAALDRPADVVIEKRALHTLKGNCRLYGLEAFAELCHQIETELAEGRTGLPLGADQRDRLRAAWREVVGRVAQLLGDRTRQVVEIDRHELDAAVDKVRHGATGRDLAALLASWAHEPVARRFERLGLHAQQLARRLGKGEIEVSIRDSGIRLEAGRWAPFWRGLIQAVNNAVDHGLEPPAERITAGKPARGLVAFGATVSHAGLRVTLSDDGRGVDWNTVRHRAEEVGLPAGNERELQAALFADGITTREAATETSGRGVGLAVLREAVNELGGTMTITTTDGAGTTLEFQFPPSPQVVVPLRPPSQPLRRQAG
ncbi:MAG TPA: ATP-binding protein [Kofleriaceae bacterium]|nr:ATP-binding protein [Kofleriaceae bacterium]